MACLLLAPPGLRRGGQPWIKNDKWLILAPLYFDINTSIAPDELKKVRFLPFCSLLITRKQCPPLKVQHVAGNDSGGHVFERNKASFTQNKLGLSLAQYLQKPPVLNNNSCCSRFSCTMRHQGQAKAPIVFHKFNSHIVHHAIYWNRRKLYLRQEFGSNPTLFCEELSTSFLQRQPAVGDNA